MRLPPLKEDTQRWTLSQMLKLEMLYNCARDNLEGETKDWLGFIDGFTDLTKSEFALYAVKNDEQGWIEGTLDVLATSKPKAIEAYLAGGFHRMSYIKETELAEFEPLRRTDFLSDDEFLQLETVNSFFKNFGLFHMMIVPAVLDDQRTASFLLWRDQSEENFDDAEKMRIGLFMRYLMKVIAPQRLIHGGKNRELIDFGRTFELTDAEMEVLGYLIEGYSLRNIAAETERTYGTVRWHVRNLLEKCQVPDQKNLLRQFYSLIKR